MRIGCLKLIACGLVFGGFIGSSLVAKVALFFASSAKQKQSAIYLTQFWARRLIRVLGIKIQFAPHLSIPRSQGCLVVSDHQSYLGILVLAAHFPVQFVAKKEVSGWPIIGWTATLGHTIFIHRGSTRHSFKRAQAITASLQEGINVLVFPEGTSTNGTDVLPFKQMLFCTAIKAGSPVLPLTLNYLTINEQPINAQTRDLCCWCGEMEFVSHFWNVLALRQIEVSLEVHAMLNPPHAVTAQEPARRAHEKVASRFTAAPTTAPTANESIEATAIDASGEFLLGAVLLSLVNHEAPLLNEGEDGEA